MFWRTGAQLVALNWQRFDLGMQQNEALFRGSGGMVLKPEYVHKGDAPELRLSIRVVSSPAVCSVTVLYLELSSLSVTCLYLFAHPSLCIFLLHGICSLYDRILITDNRRLRDALPRRLQRHL